MENFGRLNIKGDVSGHITLNNTNINYKGNVLSIDGKDKYSFIESGESYFSINSENCSGENLVSLNSDNVYSESYGVSINSNDVYKKDESIIINVDSDSGNSIYNASNLIKGYKNNNYTFGSDVEITDELKNVYVFGNVDTELESDTLYLKNGESSVKLNGEGVISKNDKITNSSISLSGENVYEFDGNWNDLDRSLLQGITQNSDIRLNEDNLSIQSGNIIYGGYNNEENKVVNSIIYSDNLSEESYIKNSIDLSTSNNLQLTNSVYIDSGELESFKCNDGLYLNSSFSVTPSGMNFCGSSLAYDEFFKFSDVDKNYKDEIYRVYAKASISADYDSDLIYNILQNDSIVYEEGKDFVKVDVGSKSILFTVEYNSEEFEKFSNSYVFDVFNLTDYTHFRIYYDGTDYFVDDCGQKLNIAFRKRSINKLFTYTFLSSDLKDKTILVKFANYVEINNIIFSNNHITIGEVYNLGIMPRSVYRIDYDGTELDCLVKYSELITKNYFIDNKNTKVEIKKFIVENKLGGDYGDILSEFDSLGRDKPDEPKYVLGIRREGGLLKTFVDNSFNLTYIKPNPKKLDYVDECYCFDQHSNQPSVHQLYRKHYTESTDVLRFRNFYKSCVVNFDKWGAYCNYSYTNASLGNATEYNEIKSLFTNEEEFFHYYIPFHITTKEYGDIMKPINGQILPIKMYIKYGNGDDDFNVIVGEFGFDKSFNSDSFYPSIKMYTSNYFKTFYNFNERFCDYDIRTEYLLTKGGTYVETETLTYLSEIFA